MRQNLVHAIGQGHADYPGHLAVEIMLFGPEVAESDFPAVPEHCQFHWPAFACPELLCQSLGIGDFLLVERYDLVPESYSRLVRRIVWQAVGHNNRECYAEIPDR